MDKDYSLQSRFSKEVLLSKYNEEGFPMEYADFFWKKYCEVYDEIGDFEDCSDEAFRQVREGLDWYILYKKIGHPESWCQIAWSFGREYNNPNVILEAVADCLQEVYGALWKEFPEDANRELERHCGFVAKEFNKSPIFMRFFHEWNEGLVGGSDMLPHFDEMEQAYAYAQSKGKDDDFAYYYATSEGDDPSANWRISEAREKLKTLGWDEGYIFEYLEKYRDGIYNNGIERSHPDIPTDWEVNIIAYMNGWDYARNNNLDKHFVDVYQNVYLNAYHADNPEVIPWNRFDAFVLDIALRRYKGEDAEIEPYDPELIEERIRSYRATESKRRPGYSLNDEMWDIMYPNGMDD